MFDNATLGQQARDVCGDNKECLFDIHTTGKVSIGRATKQAVESFVALIYETETPGKYVNLIAKKGSSRGHAPFFPKKEIKASFFLSLIRAFLT